MKRVVLVIALVLIVSFVTAACSGASGYDLDSSFTLNDISGQSYIYYEDGGDSAIVSFDEGEYVWIYFPDNTRTVINKVDLKVSDNSSGCDGKLYIYDESTCIEGPYIFDYDTRVWVNIMESISVIGDRLKVTADDSSCTGNKNARIWGAKVYGSVVCNPSCSAPYCGQDNGCGESCSTSSVGTGYVNNCDSTDVCGNPRSTGSFNSCALSTDISCGEEVTTQCDGIDNDCDGAPDNGPGMECVLGSANCDATCKLTGGPGVIPETGLWGALVNYSSNSPDSHACLVSSPLCAYPYSVQIDTSYLGDSIEGVRAIGLSTDPQFNGTNAHAETNVQSNYINISYMRPDIFSSGICGYTTPGGDCSDLSAEHNCVFGLSDETNAHLSQCDIFQNEVKFCCKFETKIVIGNPIIPGDDCEIISFEAEDVFVGGPVNISYACAVPTDIKLMIFDSEGNPLLASEYSDVCSSVEQIYEQYSFTDTEQVAIARVYTSNCTKEKYFAVKSRVKSSIPDNNLFLVLLIVMVVSLVLVKRKD